MDMSITLNCPFKVPAMTDCDGSMVPLKQFTNGGSNDFAASKNHRVGS